MVTKKPKGLGRGLEALLGPKVEATAAAAATADAPAAANPGQPASLRQAACRGWPSSCQCASAVSSPAGRSWGAGTFMR